jgi:hypothetical protein
MGRKASSSLAGPSIKAVSKTKVLDTTKELFICLSISAKLLVFQCGFVDGGQIGGSLTHGSIGRRTSRPACGALAGASGVRASAGEEIASAMAKMVVVGDDGAYAGPRT